MTLSKREKSLAIGVGVFGAFAAFLVLWQFGFSGDESLSQLQSRYDDLTTKVQKKTSDLQKAKHASRRLDEWQRRSLPYDVESARTLYLNWLREKVSQAGFRETKVNFDSKQLLQKSYEELKYSVRAQADLRQLIRFLYEFYKAGHLHKVTHLQITPMQKSNDLDLIINISALSLISAERRDKLTSEAGNRLKLKSSDDYAKIIAERNVFAVYKPKPPDRPPVVQEKETEKPKPPKFEHLEFTKLTGIVEIDGQLRAWIETKTTGDSYKLLVGEEATIASVKVVILRIGTREVEMQIGDETKTIALGQNFLGK
jgi:hypothetical protein